MALKISDYPAKTTIHLEDLLDFSNTEDSGLTYNESQKVTVQELLTYINGSGSIDNIYTANGTLLADRQVTSNTFYTRFIGGDVQVVMNDEITDYAFTVGDVSATERGRLGYDQATASGLLTLSSNADGSWFNAVDGQVGIGTTTPSEKLEVNGNANIYTTLTPTSTANPDFINLGGTYSNVEGDNLKLILADLGGLTAGLGYYSDGMFYKSANSNQRHSWFQGSASKVMEIAGGNLGIGTGATTPISRLHLKTPAGTGAFSGLYVENGTPSFIVLDNGKVGIGTTTPNASASLDITSTTQGFLPPRMTTTEKNNITTPATGLVVYDATLNKLAVYTGAAWETVTSV